MMDDIEHPVAVLNALEDPLEIIEREFNQDEYFQVLDCPELEDNKQIGHQNGDAISETTRSYPASGTNLELIENKITESDDSGSVGASNLTEIQESAAPEEFKYNSMSSPSLPQPSSAAADLLRNRISNQKNEQSASSSLILGKTGSGRNLKKVSISNSPLEVPRFVAEDNQHQDGVAIRKTTRSHLESGTDEEFTNSNTTQSDDSGSVVSDRDDTNTTKELSSCTRPMVVLKGLKEYDASDEFRSNHKIPPPQPSSDAANIKHRLRNKSSKMKSEQPTSSRITHGKTGSRNLKKGRISGSCFGVRGQEKYKCFFCEKEWCSSVHLENHIRVHTREKPFKCSSCKKTFRQLSNVRRHRKTHTGERPFKCSICEKAYARRSAVKQHEIIHTGKKPFKCTFCSTDFAHSSSLKNHLATHTGERPFNCTICAKTFSRLYDLRIHYTTHTGERPFKCTSCTKTFARMFHLKRHEIIHSGERKPFKCSYCPKGFSRLDASRKHERRHNGDRP